MTRDTLEPGLIPVSGAQNRIWVPILCLILLVVSAALADTNPSPVIINIHAPRAAIRTELLQQTPPGSSIEYVNSFVSDRLQRTPGGVAEISLEPPNAVPRAAKIIQIYLGQYYKHLGAVFLTAPMVVHENVSARWLFDRRSRLIDIVVDKQAGVY